MNQDLFVIDVGFDVQDALTTQISISVNRTITPSERCQKKQHHTSTQDENERAVNSKFIVVFLVCVLVGEHGISKAEKLMMILYLSYYLVYIRCSIDLT